MKTAPVVERALEPVLFCGRRKVPAFSIPSIGCVGGSELEEFEVATVEVWAVDTFLCKSHPACRSLVRLEPL